MAGAAVVFFAFIGFDIVATTAEEAQNPQRDVPIGILGSLAIVTLLYAAVCLVVTGVQDYRDIDPEDGAPLATAFDAAGVSWMGDLISIGACIGLVVVAMILMLGQSRVAFAMARDGLLPQSLARVHPKYGTPHRITLIAGVAIAAIAGFVDLQTLANLVNIGTLFAFILVSIAVLVLRRTRPDLPRAFRTPIAPVVAGLAVLMCLYLMLNLTGETWERFVIWMASGSSSTSPTAAGTRGWAARAPGAHARQELGGPVEELTQASQGVADGPAVRRGRRAGPSPRRGSSRRTRSARARRAPRTTARRGPRRPAGPAP